MNKNELARYFVCDVVKPGGNIERRIETAIVSIEKLLEIGWAEEDIRETIDSFAKTYPSVIRNVYHLEEILGQLQPPGNLLDKDVFYYHNELRLTSAPAVIYQDKTTGEWIRKEERFFLEMKKCYNMNQLLKYWQKSTGVKLNDHTKRQDEGRFKYLLGFYTVDEILFTIDAAALLRRERQQQPLRNVLDLDKYIDDGRELLMQKVNVHKLSGINQIVPKGVNNG